MATGRPATSRAPVALRSASRGALAWGWRHRVELAALPGAPVVTAVVAQSAQLPWGVPTPDSLPAIATVVAGVCAADSLARSEFYAARRQRARIGAALVAANMGRLPRHQGGAQRPPVLAVPVRTPAGWRVDGAVPAKCSAREIATLAPRLSDALNAEVRVEPARRPYPGVSGLPGRVREMARSGGARPASRARLVPAGGFRMTVVEKDTLASPLTSLWPVLVPGPDGEIPARRWDEPIPVAVDEDGETVTLSFANRPAVLVAGESGSGKSAFTHEVVLAWLLDPRARLIGWDGKGLLELSRYRSLAEGLAGPDPVEGTELLAKAKAEMDRREAYLKSRGREQADPDDEVCYPLLLVLEELTAYSKHPDFWTILLYLLVRVRACNMRILMTIQRPSGKVMPTDVRDNVGMKVCHSVVTPQASDMCLGEGWASNGWNAQDIPLDETGQYAGISLMLTDGAAGPRRVRSWWPSPEVRDAVTARVAVLRRERAADVPPRARAGRPAPGAVEVGGMVKARARPGSRARRLHAVPGNETYRGDS